MTSNVKKELLLEERKEVSLKILKEIDRVCRKHDITYYLAYGTLIGAVRHKGFIPWDDDIDLWVMWKDYYRLIDALEKETGYEIINDRKDRMYPLLFTKVSDPETAIEKVSKKKGDFRRGIGVDIFPLCVYEDSKRFRRRHTFLLIPNKVICQSKMLRGKPDKSLRDKVAIIGCKAASTVGLGDRFWKKKRLESWLAHNRQKEGGLVFNPYSPYKWRDVHRAEDFERTVELPFEDSSFMAPAGYDRILTEIYGDYMQLPPVEKRNSGHDVIAYRIEKEADAEK